MIRPVTLASLAFVLSACGSPAPPSTPVPATNSSAVSINGVGAKTSRDDLIGRFGQPKQENERYTHYVRDNDYVTLHDYANGTREVEGDHLELDGRVVAEAGVGLTLEKLERILGQKAKRIAEEHDAIWFRFEVPRVNVAVSTHGASSNSVMAFTMPCSCGR